MTKPFRDVENIHGFEQDRLCCRLRTYGKLRTIAPVTWLQAHAVLAQMGSGGPAERHRRVRGGSRVGRPYIFGTMCSVHGRCRDAGGCD
jgi:hypothetical protein